MGTCPMHCRSPEDCDRSCEDGRVVDDEPISGGTMSTTLEAQEDLKIRLAALSRLAKSTDAARDAAAASVVRWIGELIDAKLAIFREEIARSRAPVGEDQQLRLLLTVARLLRADITSRIAWNGGDVAALDEALAPWSADPGEPINEVVPTPPAKDTGEARDAGWTHEAGEELRRAYERSESISPLKLNTALRHGFEAIADLERRIAKAIDELHGVEAGDSSVYEVIDILDPKATLNREEDERIADLEARLAEAIRERDEARSSLETAERRIGELEAALRPFARIVDKDGEEITLKWGESTYSCVLFPKHFRAARDAVRPPLTPDAGTARSEDEEG